MYPSHINNLFGNKNVNELRTEEINDILSALHLEIEKIKNQLENLNETGKIEGLQVQKNSYNIMLSLLRKELAKRNANYPFDFLFRGK